MTLASVASRVGRLRSSHFDALVLDLRMPLVGGASLLSALSHPPPTIILSATELGTEARERLGSTVVAELRKPIAPQRLLDAVASAVGRRGVPPGKRQGTLRSALVPKSLSSTGAPEDGPD